MDIQMKKGFIETCVLKVLSQSDSYGYRIIRDISSYIILSESTLYPVLKRLEGSKCLTTYSMEHSGRLRKYYKITALGKEKISIFIKEWGEVMHIYNFISQGEQQ